MPLEGTKEEEISIVHNDTFLVDPKTIATIESHYNGKYIMETTIKSVNGNWVNMPVALFYTEEAHPEGSNYFALYHDHTGSLMITNGISAVEDEEGNPVVYEANLNTETNQAVYSAFRHDYQVVNKTMMDGGRDYARCSIEPNQRFPYRVTYRLTYGCKSTIGFNCCQQVFLFSLKRSKYSLYQYLGQYHKKGITTVRFLS